MLNPRPMTDTPADSGSSVATRRSYTREFKLKALEWYETNGRNITATARQFKVAPKRIREWRSLRSTFKIKLEDADLKAVDKVPFSFSWRSNSTKSFVSRG